MNQQQEQSKLTSVISKRFLVERPAIVTPRSRFGVAFAVATLITGVNWFVQSRLANAQNQRQEQLIKRVASGKKADIHELRDLTKINDLEGSIVKVTGEIQPGRFVIKRNRGDEEGYLVLAPYVVTRIKDLKDVAKRQLNEKYMLNLGWVPKESKHRILETAATDVIDVNELPEELASEEESAPALSTISAYVRKGEHSDIFRGYRNFVDEQLYKWIDLDALEKQYFSVQPAFRYVYLDRIGKEGSTEWFPLPKTEDGYIDEIKDQIAYNNKKSRQLSWGVGVLSFASAALACII